MRASPGPALQARKRPMKAIEITSTAPPRCCASVSVPTPVAGAGELLIRVTASGVNRPDVLQRTGNYPVPPGASDIPGLEVAGTIVSGDAQAMAAAGFKVGDRVCALVAGGGYAELCVAPVGQCLPVPKGLSDIEAASLPETFFTVWSNVFDRGRLQPARPSWSRAAPAASASPPSRWPRPWARQGAGHRRQRRQVQGLRGPRRRPRHQLQDAGLRRRGEEAHRRQGRGRDPRHGRRQLRRPRGQVRRRGRPHRDHRGAGRHQERVQRRPGAAPSHHHHRLDAASAAGGLQGRHRARR
jgi:hypothetical protein